MRLKYYSLTLRQISFERLFVFFLFIVLPVCILVFIFNKNLEPTISSLCDSNGRMIALRATNNAVYKYIEGVSYENLVQIQKDDNNKITALVADAARINKISNLVSLEVQDYLDNNTESSITLPIGSLVGMKLFGGYGPKIKLKTIPAGDVETKFKSQFTAAGVNQTKHSIVIEVRIAIKILAPFYVETKTYTNEILVAETVIVGDTPNSYYNVEGIENLTPKDTLNITN